jgi:signal peptidase I
VVIVALAIGLALAIQAVVVKPFQIPSGSMKPTLEVGERVLVNRASHQLGGDPEVGDIVVFHPPVTAETGGSNECGVDKLPDEPCAEPVDEASDENFIKRVVAGPGDTLSIENGQAIVNGEPLDEPYTRPCPNGDGCDLDREITVPEDHYFMMGDNRPFSRDSRFWGPVPRDWIIGEAFFTYWPIDRVGLL